MNLEDATIASDSSSTNESAVERLLHRMKERTDQIAERSEKRRNEQVNRNTELENVDAFLAAFNEMKLKLDEDLLLADQLTGDRGKLMEHFDKLVRDHSLIQQYLNESGMFLASFQVKRSQEILSELNAEIQLKMESLHPKKRFGFRNKTNDAKEKPTVPKNIDSIDSGSNLTEMKHCALDKFLAKTFFGFKDKSDETLVMKADEILNRQLNLQNLTNCTVIVLGTPGSVQVAALHGCTVLVGPSSRSAFIKDCSNCTIVMACQQVRIHNTTDTKFYLHVTGAAIIESCTGVGFAPYNLQYPALQQQYDDTGLDTSVNYWDKVEDFKWISRNEESPNMYLIAPEDRNCHWLESVDTN